MRTGLDYTAGDDADTTKDNLTSPLLFAASTSNRMVPNSPDSATYSVNLPSSAMWYATGRFYYPGRPGSNDANSFFLRIDSASAMVFGNNRELFQRWHFGGDGEVLRGAVVPLALGHLNAGVHTVTVHKREVRPLAPRLDVICFSTSPSLVPSDAEACEAIGGCTPGGSQTTASTTSTTTLEPTTTSTTLEPSTTTTTTVTGPTARELLCIAAGSDPSLTLGHRMQTGFDYTAGADADGVRDNLTSPLLFSGGVNNRMVPDSPDTASYAIVLPTTGHWYVTGRFYYPGRPDSNDANSFFLRVDSANAMRFGNNKDLFERWHFDGDGEVEHGAPTPLALGHLAAGPHTVTIHKREVEPLAPRLDVICFSSDPSLVPNDEDACEALGGCTPEGSQTTPSTTSTTMPDNVEPQLVCLAAGRDPSAFLSNDMSTGFTYTSGDDDDLDNDNLTAPLLFANSARNSRRAGSRDTATYAVDLPTSAFWYLAGRFYYPGLPGSNDANSFNVRVDSSPRMKFGNNKTQYRHWHFDGDGEEEYGALLPLPLGRLSAGPHTLVVEKREVQPRPPRLDIICFSTDPVQLPSDEEACQAIGGCNE